MIMEIVTTDTPMTTEFIRIQVSGPKPLNSLAYIRCQGGGLLAGPTELRRYRARFVSTFQIAKFDQADLDWHRANSRISAAPFFVQLDTSSDFSFVMAVEDIKPFIDDFGRIGFDVQIAHTGDFGGRLFSGSDWILGAYSISAYALLYEPRPEPPLPPIPGQSPRKLRPEIVAPRFGRKKKKFIITDTFGVGGPSDD
jgi:hypothetical protein